MSMRVVPMDQLVEIGAVLAQAAHGHRTDLARHYAERLQLSVASLYRKLKQGGLIAGPSRPRDSLRPEYREWVVVARQLALKVPKGRRPVPLWMAVRQAVADGLLPQAALEVQVSTLHRVAREMGIQDQPKKTRQLWTDAPMRVCQIDASTSEYFSVVKRLDDGDYLLRLHTTPVMDGYKNKPLFKDRLRPVIYSIWDMHSGYQLARYVAATGENAEDAAMFLLWACGDKEDARFPFQGVMETLWTDNGPLFKKKATMDLLERLGVTVHATTPYEKTAMGGVERTHRERWSWESHFFMRFQKGARFEITLSSLNVALRDYLAEIVNERPARHQPHLSRRNAWILGVNKMGGVTQIPPDAMETMAQVFRRTVRSGVFRFRYNDYEVDQMGLGEVYVLCDMTGTPHVVQNVDTGAPLTFRLVTPVMVGQEFRGIKEPPVEKLRKKADELTGQSTIFGAKGVPDGVLVFPARTLPARPLVDPLADDGCHQTIDDAMAAFYTIHTLPLEMEHRRQIRELILNAGLDRAFVRSLALRALNASHADERIAQ